MGFIQFIYLIQTLEMYLRSNQFIYLAPVTVKTSRSVERCTTVVFQKGGAIASNLSGSQKDSHDHYRILDSRSDA